MIDLYILIAYAVVFIVNRSAGSLLALLVFAFVAYTSYIVDIKYTLDATYWFLILSCVYAICANKLKKWDYSAWIGCLLMSFYSLYFSYDSWINWEIETWAYRNHEGIVITIHAFIMLLLSKVQLAMVSSRINLFWNNHCNRKDKRSN
jgi:hypothetical protein